MAPGENVTTYCSPKDIVEDLILADLKTRQEQKSLRRKKATDKEE